MDFLLNCMSAPETKSSETKEAPEPVKLVEEVPKPVKAETPEPKRLPAKPRQNPRGRRGKQSKAARPSYRIPVIKTDEDLRKYLAERRSKYPTRQRVANIEATAAEPKVVDTDPTPTAPEGPEPAPSSRVLLRDRLLYPDIRREKRLLLLAMHYLRGISEAPGQGGSS